MHHELQTQPDPAAVAAAGAAFVAGRAREAVAASGSFHFAVSGGPTPGAMVAQLASETGPWDAGLIHPGGEPGAPPHHPDPNPPPPPPALGPAPAPVRPTP